MKTAASVLILLGLWICAPNVIPDFFYRVDEQTWFTVVMGLGLASLVSLTVAFAMAGRIRLEAGELVVSTPAGFVRIPYSTIQTIRRCRRGGSGRGQHLQIVFRTGDEPKMLRVRPADVAALAMELRKRCPHLSSFSGTSLVKQARYAKLLHGL